MSKNTMLGKGTITKDAYKLRVILANAASTPGSATDHGSLNGLADDDHSQYVHISADRTITAQHNFAPATAKPPFTLGANAQGELVGGLNAEYLNGNSSTDFISVIGSPSAGNFPVMTSGGELSNSVYGPSSFAAVTHYHDSDYISIISSPTAGNFPVMTAGGELSNSVYGPSSFVPTTRTVTAGAGLSGGGALSSDITLSVNLGYAFTWTGAHIFQATLTTRHIFPEATDSYDFGSTTKLWRKGFVSELDALILAENTISAVGGWIRIAPDQGILPTELSDSATTYDFGKTMTPTHFLEFRSLGKMEYIQIGSLITGTTYNITRNLDGSGANTWPAGACWSNKGYGGTGWLDINAYDTPRIQLLTIGTTYNAQTEIVRLGDLNGYCPDYSTATYGLVVGEYGSGKVNLTIDPTNGYRLRTYATTQFSVTPNLLKFGSDISAVSTTAIAIFGAAQKYPLVTGEDMGAGDLLIGDNTSGYANILWDKSAKQLKFRGGSTTQAYIDTDGAISWGGGVGKLTSTGAVVTPASSTWNNLNSYGFKTGSTHIGGLYGLYDSTNHYMKTQLISDAATYYTDPEGALSSTNTAWANVQSLAYLTSAAVTTISASRIPEVGLWSTASITLGAHYTNGVYIDIETASFTIRPGSDTSNHTFEVDANNHIVYINDNANTKMTQGLTINQGAADNEAFAIKSGDVATGKTDWAETDTYFTIQKNLAANGGARLLGLIETGDCRAFQAQGVASTVDTTKDATHFGIISLWGVEASGTSVTNITADGNVFSIGTYKDNAYKTILIVDEDGDIHVDGSSSLGTWDNYDDVKLLTGLRASLAPEKSELRKNFSDWMTYAREPLQRSGVVTYNKDGRHFISLKGMHMLEIDAIRQIAGRQESLAEEFERLAQEHYQLTMKLETIKLQLAAFNNEQEE